MTIRIPVRGRQEMRHGHAPDPTKYVGACLGCTWQVQAGRRALRAAGTRTDLFMLMAEAHREHLLAEHPDGLDAVVDWSDGTTHAVANAGATEAALMMVSLPEWWDDWS